MALRIVSNELVQMGPGTCMWLSMQHFAFMGEMDDTTLLNELIANEAYAHDYASPYTPGHPVKQPAVHARWWRARIGRELFHPISAPEAESILNRWATEQEWDDPHYHQPAEAIMRLRGVFVVIRSGDVLRLANPGTEDEHEYGFVTGTMGFHEFVVIDRSTFTLHLIVASDG